MDLEKINKELRHKSPSEIAKWALDIAERPLITTNFRPYDVSIIHAAYTVSKEVPVVWIDSGYNTSYTYKHALKVIEELDLKIDVFVPKQSVAYRDVTLGNPKPDTAAHQEFTDQVKLEPFKRALDKYQPDVWFANLRAGQTAFRDNLDIVNLTSDGILKICPFYYWTDEETESYLTINKLDSEDRYYDPTKVHSNRECGLHT